MLYPYTHMPKFDEALEKDYSYTIGGATDSAHIRLPNVGPTSILVLSKVLWRLLQTPEVQRLRDLSSLSFSSAWDASGRVQSVPAATTDRLLHSFQVLYWTRFWYSTPCERYLENEQKTMEVAALLHDATHTAFSHALQGVAGLDSIKMVPKIIGGSNTIPAILEEEDINIKKIMDIIAEKDPLDFHTQLIAGECGVDRIAYVKEDSNKIGIIDPRFASPYLFTTLVGHIRPIEVSGRIQAGLVSDVDMYPLLRLPTYMSDEKELAERPFIEAYLLMSTRTALFRDIYNNDGNAKCVRLIREAVERAIEDKILIAEQLYRFTDKDLLQFLQMCRPHISKFLNYFKGHKPLPPTAVDIPLVASKMREVSKIRNNRDRLLDLEERVGGWICTNPVGGPSKGEFYVQTKDLFLQFNQWVNTKPKNFAKYIKPISHIVRMHEIWGTNRFRVFAKDNQEPQRVYQKTISELGIDKKDILPNTTFQKFF